MFQRRTLARRTAVIGGALGLAVALAACSTGDADTGDNGDGGDKGTITLGFIPSWTDGLSTAYLLQDQLEKIGYTVEMETLTEAAPLYTGLANGDIDIYPSAWPEVTHAKYMDEYGDDIEDLGAYYDNAKLTIAVPSYTDVDSLADLAGKGDMFDGKIYGIEPGAGLTGVTQDSMMPAYGLDDWELVTSSTSAMLTELGDAIDNKEDIVVTLWRPFWANAAFDIKDLEDPQGAMGEPEALHFLATKGFSEKYPEAADYIAGIKLDDTEYGALEDLVVNQHEEGDEPAAIDEWIASYSDAYDGILTD
ncbi:glycine betaine ABC transporter substrate-binding protein [Protaetiibacter mangrovi]|uniref:Glycine betaine ABC transporter substrate-binding protein n=1 Tax=Protaetiibacter mangrovi TaxID=2970926 RepID=A0ABT1ZEH8_9MICO|nr:glycine betaine ABC transporter substrate-binding protein [Protaetiibacter mangrovi]MCS0499076.1 glycine betaine ABC transporter substrate-binding protein [Protaetiibacter mangrovi]TPX05435.1 glycine betaine ABC transporter substrate-binding protein [Schumannella luteola]